MLIGSQLHMVQYSFMNANLETRTNEFGTITLEPTPPRRQLAAAHFAGAPA
jgi:hypothetical protein